MDALSCTPSLVIVRERELSIGGVIMGNGLRSNGSIAEIAAVFDVRMALSFIVCHSLLCK